MFGNSYAFMTCSPRLNFVSNKFKFTLCLDNVFDRKGRGVEEGKENGRKGRDGKIGVFSLQIFPMLEGFVLFNI